MTKKKIVVIGGGWAGCAAALTAEKAGTDVTLLERTDMLLGTGLVGGIFRTYCRRRMYRHGRRRPVYSYGSRCNSQKHGFSRS